MIETPFGQIISMEGARVNVELLLADENGQQPGRDLLLGSFVRIPTSQSDIYGVITSIKSLMGSSNQMAIELLGEALYSKRQQDRMIFNRGVSVHPTLHSKVYECSQAELSEIYARPDEPSLRIGSIYQDETIPAYVLMDKMLNTHFAVLGNTGTGKSCTVALFIRSMLLACPKGRIFMLDPHNEYSKAFSDVAEIMNTQNIKLPYWLFNGEEITSLIVDSKSVTADRERSLLARAVVYAREKYLGSAAKLATITVDSPIPYQMHDVMYWLNEQMGNLEKPDGSAPFLRLKTRIETLQKDRHYHFIFPGMLVEDEMAAIIGRLMRLPVDNKPVAIMDLSGVPADITNIVISVIFRLIFDFVTHSEMDTPILLLCEEAHRYIPKDTSLGFSPTLRLLSRIAQEGRKYGISLGLVTQRPSLISDTILSQCNTLVALRMSNQKDQEIVYKALPETTHGIMNSLPALCSREAVISGEGVTLPMHVRIGFLREAWRPRSDSKTFSQRWAEDEWSLKEVKRVINRWRYSTDEHANLVQLAGEIRHEVSISLEDKQPTDYSIDRPVSIQKNSKLKGSFFDNS